VRLLLILLRAERSKPAPKHTQKKLSTPAQTQPKQKDTPDLNVRRTGRSTKAKTVSSLSDADEELEEDIWGKEGDPAADDDEDEEEEEGEEGDPDHAFEVRVLTC
jgi:hypothetical protein